MQLNYPKQRYTGEKPWMDKDWLYNEYVAKDRSTQDIADEYGCKRNTIQCWLSKHKIKKDNVKRERKQTKQYQNKDYLIEEHIHNKKSMSQMAAENNVSSDTIRYHLSKNGIERWKSENERFFDDDELHKVCELYADGISANKIAEMYGTSHGVVIRALKEVGVKTRGCQDAQFMLHGEEPSPLLFDAEWLYSSHWEEGKTCKDIGEELGVDPGTVRRHMHSLGIKTMTNSESKIGRMSGENHPNWKGGVTPLKALLREYFHTNQVPKIAERDNYTCQNCGATHEILHVHHIRGFSEIVDEIIDEHKELNPDSEHDRLELYQIIIKDDRFLDENNLITYCKYCHYFIIHNYKQRKTISSQDS